MKLALMGCGAIGSIIAKAIDDGTVQAGLECVFDTDRESAKRLIGGLKKKPEIARDVEEILGQDIDLVIEAEQQNPRRSEF